ncbi:MAG: AraC family transcriptional regulator [Bacteroidota bacterium]|nr:AraC family transcriptional regulator [Bacteroidota bacterium]
MQQYLREITKLSPKDCLYIVERHKSEFNYPIHSHDDFELNFIQNGKGVRRIVGDSVEEIGDYELTLVVGSGLVHVWEQGNCTSPDIREITIQFSQELFLGNMLDRRQFDSIKAMFERATLGVTFSLQAIMKVYNIIDSIATMNDHFEQFLSFMKMLYILSNDTGARTLSSSSFAEAEIADTDSRRIRKVREHIDKHYAEDLRLDDVAAIAGMSPSAFSRFFKQHTDRNFVDYMIDVRLGHAARMLVDSTTGISEICYACGFNNLSNFNRTFKARRGYTPRDFRAVFKRNRVVV